MNPAPLNFSENVEENVFKNVVSTKSFSVASDDVSNNIFKGDYSILSSWFNIMGLQDKISKNCTKLMTTYKVNWRRGSNLDK